jgi:hypothetical protein
VAERHRSGFARKGQLARLFIEHKAEAAMPLDG